MNLRSVVIIALLGLIIGTIAWRMSTPDGTEQSRELLFSELISNIESVDSLDLQNAGGEKISLKRNGQQWLVDQAHDYSADNTKVNELLIALNEAAAIEQKTSNPEYYARLGVQDIDQPSSKAVLVTARANDVEQLSLLVGNEQQRAGGSSYVRFPDQAQAVLVAPKINASIDINFWLDRVIFDIATNELQAVRLQRDEQVIEMTKSSRFGSEFVVDEQKEGDEWDANKINSLSSALQGLRFDEVKPRDGLVDEVSDELDATYTLFDGIVLDIRVLTYEHEEEAADQLSTEHWLTATARFDEDIAKQFVPQPTTDASAELPGEFSFTEADIADRKTRVENINQRVKNWAYRVNTTTYAKFNKLKQ